MRPPWRPAWPSGCAGEQAVLGPTHAKEAAPMATIPDNYNDLFSADKKAFAHLATIQPDGTPQVTPVWFDMHDGKLRFNTARGRVKDRNLRANPNVAIAISDPANPYRYIQIRGRVVAITENGADLNIEDLSMKYTKKHWTRVEGQVRVMYMIFPEHVTVGD
jgi:PPOX class probable F420-dependent enzyme